MSSHVALDVSTRPVWSSALTALSNALTSTFLLTRQEVRLTTSSIPAGCSVAFACILPTVYAYVSDVLSFEIGPRLFPPPSAPGHLCPAARPAASLPVSIVSPLPMVITRSDQMTH